MLTEVDSVAKGKEVAERPDNVPDVAINDAVRAQFAAMAMAVPDQADDASASIVLAILSATTWDELDDPWDTAKADVMVDIEQRIDSITRHPSDYADGLGIFLVVKGQRVDTGEQVVWPTGSVSVVAQLVKAYLLGAFPLYAILRKAERPTAKGYHPLHLEVIGSGGTGVAPDATV